MKSKLPLALLFLMLSITACRKTSTGTDNVFIRIENTTADNFTDLTLNTTSFGAIAGGHTTAYFRCKNVYPVPFANWITINHQPLYIADIVPTPFMKNGKYLMKVESDSLLRYKASFINE